MLLVTTWLCVQPPAAAGGARPSLFRGVVVAESPLGVRVVSLEETAQAYQTDLRPEDIIVRINEAQIRSIDEFAAASASLRGASEAAVLVFRTGQPRALRLHLFSMPVLAAWGIECVPQHDIRFAQPDTGLRYWSRLGRGFEEAGKPAEALDAYLNALHNVPEDAAAALRAEALLLQISRQALEDGRMAEGVRLLRQGMAMMERLFERPLSSEELDTLRQALRRALAALRAARIASASPA